MGRSEPEGWEDQNLKDMGVTVFRTDLQGDIILREDSGEFPVVDFHGGKAQNPGEKGVYYNVSCDVNGVTHVNLRT